MDVLVFGAGAVGGYLGTRLAHAGHKVTFISRRPTAEAIKRLGITVIEGDQQTHAKPVVVPALREAFLNNETYDIILLTVKSYDAQAALYELVAFAPKPFKIITLQNGIGIEEEFMVELGSDGVIAGSLTTPLSHETANSVIVERLDRGLALAPSKPENDISNWVDLFDQAGLITIGLNDYRSMKWSKALLNMVGNASSAILNRHPKLIYSYGPTFDLEINMLKEALAVMKAKNLRTVDLPGAQATRLALAVNRLPKSLAKPILSGIVGAGRGNKMPSFHIDLMSGRELNEVTYHNGAVAEAGELAGIPTPVNTALYEILMKIARQEIDYQEYNGRPKKLVAEVKKYQNSSTNKQ